MKNNVCKTLFLERLYEIESDDKFQMRNLLEKRIEVTHPIVRWDQYCAIVQSKQLTVFTVAESSIDCPCYIK